MAAAERRSYSRVEDLDSSSDDDSEGVSHFVIPRPLQQKSYRDKKSRPAHFKLNLKRPSEEASGCCRTQTIVLVLFGVVGLLILSSLVLYIFFVHMRLQHLQDFVLKAQLSAASSNTSGQSEMTSGQLDQIKAFNDLHQNLSEIHNQLVNIQTFYKDIDQQNPNIVQFLNSITQQLSPLSQSVVLLSDGFHDIQKNVKQLDEDKENLKEALDVLTLMTQELQGSVADLHNETLSLEMRISVLELIRIGADDDENVVTNQKLRSMIAEALMYTLRDLNSSVSAKNGGSVPWTKSAQDELGGFSERSERRFRQLEDRIANNSLLINDLKSEVEMLGQSGSLLSEEALNILSERLAKAENTASFSGEKNSPTADSPLVESSRTNDTIER